MTSPEVAFEATAPQFIVSDVRAAAEHYRDVLGFEILGYFQEPPVHAIVARGPVEIFLALATGRKGTSNRELKSITFDAYVRVSEVRALHQELKAKGAEILEAPVMRIYGMLEMAVRDLDGFVLMFGQEG